jgi:UDP-N-acetylglucosamine 3-dehydrogenase
VIRVALVGLGTMGRNHLRVLVNLEGVELAAVCDQDARQLGEAGRGYSVPTFESWDQAFAKTRLDAAVIAVPTRFHLQAAMAALDRGLHVLVEKPLASDLDEGRRLVEAARRAGRLLAVGHIERFNPAIRELQRHVAAGEIGRIFQIQARRQGPFPARIRDVGVVIDLATHDLDVMDHVVASPVQRLYAETEQRIHTEHEDILNALIRFDSGVLGVLQVNWLTPTKIRELSVLGEKGLYLCNYMTQELTYFENAELGASARDPQSVQSVSEGQVVSLPVTKAEPLQLELESFFAAVRRGGPVEVDGEAGLRALHLALALVESAKQGRALSRRDLEQLWSRRAHQQSEAPPSTRTRR